MYVFANMSRRLGAIVPPDNRQLVRDVSKPPYRWICALDLSYPYQGAPQRNIGTGVLISPRHVLTVAHNVVPARGVTALGITVVPGLNGTNLLGGLQAPVGSMKLTAGSWWVPPQYTGMAADVWDLALLTLPKEFPPQHGMTYGHWSDPRYPPHTRLAAIRQADVIGAAMRLAGYPADKCGKDTCAPCVPQAIQNYVAVRDKKTWGSTQWEASGTVQPGPPPGLLLYDADTCTGMSGSPVWFQAAAHDVRLIGVHAGAQARANPGTGVSLNHGILMGADVVDLLRQRVRGDGVAPTF